MDSIVMIEEGPDARAAEIAVFKEEFLRWASQTDLTKPCPVGVRTSDLDGRRMRQPIWHVVADAMTEKNEFTQRAMTLLCELGQYDKRARELLSDMAEHWAELRCDL